MKAALAIAVALALFGGTLIWRTVGAMCAEEINTRIGLLPNALLRVAALRLPHGIRSDLADEWTAELDFIVSGTDGLPMTRLLRGLRFATSLLLTAKSVAHELTGPCTCSRLWIVTSTTWYYLAYIAAAGEAEIAFDSLSRSHNTAAGISAAFLALGFLIANRLPRVFFGSLSWDASRRRLSVSAQTPIEVHGGLRFAIGYMPMAVGELVQGGALKVATGITFSVTAATFVSICWKLRRLQES